MPPKRMIQADPEPKGPTLEAAFAEAMANWSGSDDVQAALYDLYNALQPQGPINPATDLRSCLLEVVANLALDEWEFHVSNREIPSYEQADLLYLGHLAGTHYTDADHDDEDHNFGFWQHPTTGVISSF